MAIEFLIFMLTLNAGLVLVATQTGVTPLSPFNSTNTTGMALNSTEIQQFNTTSYNGTIFGQDLVNNTGDAGGILDPAESLFYPIQVIQTFIGFMTGSIAGDVLAEFGFPTVFGTIIALIQGIFLAITIIYYVTGRGG